MPNSHMHCLSETAGPEAEPVLILERILQGVFPNPWNFKFPDEPQSPEPGGGSNIRDLPVRCRGTPPSLLCKY